MTNGEKEQRATEKKIKAEAKEKQWKWQAWTKRLEMDRGKKNLVTQKAQNEQTSSSNCDHECSMGICGNK